MTAKHKQPEGHRHREFVAMLGIAAAVSVVFGGQYGLRSAFVWWQVCIEVLLGAFCFHAARGPRIHAGTIMLVLAGSAIIGVATGTTMARFHP